ncbi:MAG: DNRLRE domain-containing protein [Ignavibacteriae bacterium]|nr:DNRLRE domain-containing protein [Ignavibacteriota bacterium]
MIKNLNKILLILAVLSFPFLNGCQNNLTDQGIEFISSDTLGTLLLDSQIDSLNITSNSFVKYINTASSKSMFIGKYGNYESKVLLKFTSVPSNYSPDSSTILSAKLNLRYNKTFYEDSTGFISFNVYKILNSYDLKTVTYDKFNASHIGTDVIGTFSGALTDTNRFSVTLDNQTIKDWFKYAYDTNYTNKNYGIALVANSSSTTIKGLYSANHSDSLLVPVVTVVFMNNPSGRIDTINLNYTDFTTLSYIPTVSTIPGRMVIQNGVAIKDIMHFDISKLPGKVVINQATLELKIDYANSFISKGVDKRYAAFMLTSDSLTNDGSTYYSYVKDGDTSAYTVYLTYALQKWNYGLSTNFGIQIQNSAEYLNLDRYVFYGPDYSDVSKRPRLRIRYSIRR